MNTTFPHFLSIDALRKSRSTTGIFPWRCTVVFVAALTIPNFLAATARADATYSGTLEASLTVSGFLDAERNPISKPAGLTLSSEAFFFPDSFAEGEATANADGALDIIAGDPFDLGAGDRIDFRGDISGTTVYTTGSSIAGAFGFSNIFMDNASPDPVTISFDVEYDYALSVSVDDPQREYAGAFLAYYVFREGEPSDLEEFFLFELDAFVEYNESLADMGAGSFEVTLPPGQTQAVSVSAYIIGDPTAGTVPEPTSWLLGALGAALLLGRRRTADQIRGAIR
jgi:MYXO-CTERM domain-containing protein